MPRINIKPLIKLNREQLRSLVIRTMEKEGKFTTKVADEILKHEPPVTKSMGILRRDFTDQLGNQRMAQDVLPIGEARAKYFSNPAEFSMPKVGAPSTLNLRKVPEGSPDELASGLAYERLNFQPVVPSSVKRSLKTTEIANKEVMAEQTGASAKQQALPEAKQMLQDSVVADNLWRLMTGRSGSRSMAAKIWEGFRMSTPQHAHPSMSNTRDYFISCFTRFKKQPEKFVKKHPREARLLKEMEAQLQENPEAWAPPQGGGM